MRYCAPVSNHWIVVGEEAPKSYGIRCYNDNELLLLCHWMYLAFEQGAWTARISKVPVNGAERKWECILLSTSNFYRKYFKNHLNELQFIRYQTRIYHAMVRTLPCMFWVANIFPPRQVQSLNYLYFANDSLAIYWHIAQCYLSEFRLN